MKVGYKNPSLAITFCHHSASLVMPSDANHSASIVIAIGDPRDGYVHTTPTQIMDSYKLSFESRKTGMQANFDNHIKKLILRREGTSLLRLFRTQFVDCEFMPFYIFDIQ